MKKIFYYAFIAAALFLTYCKSDKAKKQVDQYYSIGQTKMEVKDYNGAVSAFTRCININPNNYDAYHQRALAYKALDNKKLALYNYKRAQTIMEKNEDLTDPGKHGEYQSLLQEIKEYTDAPATPVTPQANPVVPDTSHM
jgi:Tfp pilus assembly protein PilF